MCKETINTKEQFPNGFENWHETHFEITRYILDIEDNIRELIIKANLPDQGTGGVWILARNWTTLFEQMYKDIVWDGEWHDILEAFLKIQVDRLTEQGTVEDAN